MDARTLSRKGAAYCLVAGPALFALSALFSVSTEEEVADYLADVSGATGRHVFSGALFMLGGFALLIGMLGVAHLLRARRLTLGQVAAWMVALGATIGVGVFVIGVFDAEAAEVATDRVAMVELLERAEDSVGANVFFIVLFALGILLGNLLLALALLRRRAAGIPVWVPGVIVAGLILSFVFGDGILGALAFLVLAAGYWGIAGRMLAVSDEEWERWSPLGEAAARPDEVAPPAAPTASA